MPELEELSSQVGEALLQRQLLIAVAESCTGGWLAKCLTDIAGSSGWFDRGFVTYSNAAKQDMLGVSDETLAVHGAVSEQTVLEMAAGALRQSEAGYAVAISGIAGPGGGAEGKPVGTVCFAWQQRGEDPRSETCLFKGDRDAVRRQSVEHVLAVILDELDSK